MAHERPVSRHGGYDALKEFHVDDTNKYVYQIQDFPPSRPKSGYKKRSVPTAGDEMKTQVSDYQSYDETQANSPYNHYAASGAFFTSHPSEQASSPSPMDAPPFSSPHPPQTKGGRPSSSARRSRQSHSDDIEWSENPFDNPRESPDISSSRPSSSFSVYRPLPAIGTPSVLEPDFSHHFPSNEPWNKQPPNSARRSHHQAPPSHSSNNQPVTRHSTSTSSTNRIHSAVSDISVISSKASSSSSRSNDLSVATQLVERLDLSQLNRSASSTRRRRHSNHSSPSHKLKTEAQLKSQHDSGELYDGDDDDSDTNTNNSEAKDVYLGHAPASSVKKPVIIPSENRPVTSDPDQSILLAIKLPTDGTRHQRYFQRQETLMAIVEFAEEQAGQDFAGYILVASAPKTMYDNLGQTIEEVRLEDRTVLHLEEKD